MVIRAFDEPASFSKMESNFCEEAVVFLGESKGFVAGIATMMARSELRSWNPKTGFMSWYLRELQLI
jgi:hypothetical protein